MFVNCWLPNVRLRFEAYKSQHHERFENTFKNMYQNTSQNGPSKGSAIEKHLEGLRKIQKNDGRKTVQPGGARQAWGTIWCQGGSLHNKNKLIWLRFVSEGAVSKGKELKGKARTHANTPWVLAGQERIYWASGPTGLRGQGLLCSRLQAPSSHSFLHES